MTQLTLIRKTDEERIDELKAALKIYGKHSLFCCWEDGRYRKKTLICTCGLNEALKGDDDE